MSYIQPSSTVNLEKIHLRSNCTNILDRTTALNNIIFQAAQQFEVNLKTDIDGVS